MQGRIPYPQQTIHVWSFTGSGQSTYDSQRIVLTNRPIHTIFLKSYCYPALKNRHACFIWTSSSSYLLCRWRLIQLAWCCGFFLLFRSNISSVCRVSTYSYTIEMWAATIQNTSPRRTRARILHRHLSNCCRFSTQRKQQSHFYRYSKRNARLNDIHRKWPCFFLSRWSPATGAVTGPMAGLNGGWTAIIRTE